MAIRNTLRVLALVLILSGLCTICTRAQAQSSPSPVGVWEIVELVNWSPSGERSEPYGTDPSGYFVYTPGGRLILHIMKNPPLSPQETPPGTEDLAARARASIAYYGTYSVDLERGIIYHEIKGDLSPNRIGTSQPRPYRIDGDQLTIDIKGENGGRYLRKLRRVESFAVP